MFLGGNICWDGTAGKAANSGTRPKLYAPNPWEDGASIQSLFGGNISLYTTLCERARDDAFNQMLAHGGALGANAVVGVRYDATEIAPGITEVLCYGTAVSVERAG